MRSTVTVPGGGRLEYDATNWKEPLGEVYLELCRCVASPGENRSVELGIERVARVMLDLARKYCVDPAEMIAHLHLQCGKFADEEDTRRTSNRKEMTDGDHATLRARILEIYACEMTRVALEREHAAQPDLQDSHTKAQHVLGARGRSSFPC